MVRELDFVRDWSVIGRNDEGWRGGSQEIVSDGVGFWTTRLGERGELKDPILDGGSILAGGTDTALHGGTDEIAGGTDQINGSDKYVAFEWIPIV